MAIQEPIKTNFSAGEWSPLLKGRVDLQKYNNAAETISNFKVLPQGGIERRGGAKYIATAKAECRLVKFEFSVTQAYILEFSNLAIRFYKDQGQIISGTPVEVVTPYTTAQLDELQFTQSADTLYIVHASHEPAKLTRTSDTAWTLTDIDFTSPPFEEDNESTTTIAASALTGSSVTFTASAAEFTSADVGTKFRFNENIQARFPKWIAGASVTSGDYRYYGDNLYRSSTTATTGDDPPLHLEDSESDGVVTWVFVNSGYGVAVITAYTDTTHVDGDIEIDLSSSYTAGYTKWSRAQWNSTNGYPSAVSFFQERLWFAGSTAYPQALWASVSGDFENFTVGILDDASLEYTISSDQVNAIRWLSPGKVLAIGTIGGEFILSASQLNEAVTPTNVNIVRESANGSLLMQPVRPSNSILYVQRSGRKLNEFEYDFENDAYLSSNISILSEHIIENGIKAIALQQAPNQVVYMVRNDGKLIAFTYQKDQDVNAWTEQTIGGVADEFNADAIVESVAILPAENTLYDEVWVSVQRYVNGSTVRHVEVIQPGLEPEQEVIDSFFVDSGLSSGLASTAEFNITNCAYASDSVDLTELAIPNEIFFKPDGSKMYVMQQTDDTVYQYTLSPIWELATATYDSLSFDLSTQSSSMTTLAFSTDGLKMYSTAINVIYEYDLSIAWDLGSASFSQSKTLTDVVGIAESIAFKSDGTKLFAHDSSGDHIRQFSLDAWDVSTITYDSKSKEITEITGGGILALESSGEFMFIMDAGGGTDLIYQYKMTTNFDISTASSTGNTYDMTAEASNPQAMFIPADSSRLYISDGANEDIFRYNTELTPFSSFSGLSHLEGETVSILADGSVVADKTVVSGSITLDSPASRVHIGLGFTSRAFTLDLEAGAQPGDTAHGKIKRIDEVILRLHRSVGMQIGDSAANLDTIPFRDSSMAMDQPVPLFSGLKRVPFRSKHEREAQIYIKQDQPLPLTLLALMPRVKTNFG